MIVSVLLVALGAPPAASGQGDAGEVNRARAIAAQGFAAYDRKDYAAAIALFARAHEIAPDAGLLYNIAQSYRQIGSSACDEALIYYRKFMSAKKSERDRVTRENVEARIAEMEACVERRNLAAPEPADDGATRKGSSSASAPLEIGGEDDSRTSGARRTAGWVVTGAGGAALALAAVSAVMSIRLRSELEDGCSGGVCPPDLRDEVTSYDRWRYTGFVSAGAGVVAVGVGVWMLMTGDRSQARGADRTGALRPMPWVDTRTIGLAWWF